MNGVRLAQIEGKKAKNEKETNKANDFHCLLLSHRLF